MNPDQASRSSLDQRSGSIQEGIRVKLFMIDKLSDNEVFEHSMTGQGQLQLYLRLHQAAAPLAYTSPLSADEGLQRIVTYRQSRENLEGILGAPTYPDIHIHQIILS